jgi:hypothetical protein
MKRPQKILSGPNKGKYNIKGKFYDKLFGSRRMVHNGTAYKTRGNLTIKDLYHNKATDRIVSRKKHFWAIKNKPLKKHGWTAKKGKFGAVRISDGKTISRRRGRGSRRTRRQRGGFGVGDDMKYQSQSATLDSSYGDKNLAYNVKSPAE